MSLCDLEFRGRIQGLVMLGFGGFGIAALPLGLLADAVGLRATFAVIGVAVVLTVFVVLVISRHDCAQVTLRAGLNRAQVQSTPGSVAFHDSANRPSSTRCTISQVSTDDPRSRR
jgi:predicted MFS family arabinose efflux permease